MIAAAVSVAVMALLFVLFGAFGVGDGSRGCGGSCDECGDHCDMDLDSPGR